jgi:hypothetical protein
MSTEFAQSNVKAIINSYGTYDVHFHVKQSDTISLNAKLSLAAHIVKSQGLVQNEVLLFLFSKKKTTIKSIVNFHRCDVWTHES